MNSTIAVGMTVLLGAFYCWTSRINGLYFFGRTADADLRASEQGRAITRQYLLSIVIVTVATSILTWSGNYIGHRWLSTASWLLEFVSFLMIFARANGKAKALAQRHPATQEETVIQVALLEQPTYWIPGLPSILLPLLACLGALATAVLLAGNGSGLSAGWEAWTGAIDRQGYAAILGFATGILIASAGLLLMFRGAARMRTKMAQYTVRSCISLEWIGATLLIATVVCSRLGFVVSKAVSRDVMFAGMVVAIAVLVWNQSRSKRFVPPPVEVGGDDRWRWGLFYVDHNDPALFVQSRCGVGYTLNYGRVLAWPISLGLVAYLVAVLFFLPHHH